MLQQATESGEAGKPIIVPSVHIRHGLNNMLHMQDPQQPNVLASIAPTSYCSPDHETFPGGWGDQTFRDGPDVTRKMAVES